MAITRMVLKNLMVSGFVSMATLAHADDIPPQGRVVTVAISEVFVPNGFDDNDEVEVVLDGQLPDSCYRLAHNEVKYDAARGRYVVFQFARRYPGICLPATVPFFISATLGVVPQGDFDVQTVGAEKSKLTVKEASSAGPDDYTYAPVDSVSVERDAVKNQYFGVLRGRFTNSCMQLGDLHITNSGKTIEVQPVLGMRDADDCQAVEIPFSHKFALPEDISEGRHLLHVRSLNGKAANTVFSVYPVGF